MSRTVAPVNTSLLDKAVAIGPGYLTDLLSLIQQPKRFVASRVSRDPVPIRDALAFLAISFALSWVVKMSFLRSAPWLEVLPDAAFVLMEVLTYGAAICLAWRVVRGRAELQKIFVIHFYYSGVFLLLMVVWFMLLMGVIKSFDPVFYKAMLEALYGGTFPSFLQERTVQATQSPAAAPTALIVIVGFSAALAWLFAGWGAYRELNGVSKFRSVIAAIVFVALWFPISAVSFFIANAGVN
jgi:hypothetical protein